MVDQQRQHERVIFKRMDFRRRGFNKSFDEGLALESPRNSYHSSRSAGSKVRSSGLFALFSWFKKEKSEDSDFDLPSEPNSPVLPRATSITGSVDTLFSTATANSFAYVHPLQYRPFGTASPPDVRIQIGPETSTYRNRIRERDRLRGLEENISLRKKYKLYASGTLPRSVDHIHELSDEHFGDFKRLLDLQPYSRNLTLGRKKRNAPPPPAENSQKNAGGFPEVLENKENLNNCVKQHRRTASEPVKACHVKGKRKAPPPPGNSIDLDVISTSTTNSNSSKRSRKKRRAPSPPAKKVLNTNDSGIFDIIQDAPNSILNEELIVSGNESHKEETASNASTLDIGSADVVCTDTLKLERGILKPNMDSAYSEPKLCPSSPVSPRPWYKRAANKDCGSVKDKDKKKERDRRKVEDWMLESGFPRRSLLSYDNKYNIFSRVDKSDDKRKSQISILTNISELDREAAEIIRRGKEREKSLIDTQNAKFYSDSAILPESKQNVKGIQNEPQKSSARDLISLFNAITNVTKVSMNPAFFSQDAAQKDRKENKPKFHEEMHENKFIYSGNNQPIEIESFDEIVHGKFPEKADIVETEIERPGTSASGSSGKIARVTIEELDEYDAERNSKSQILYDANKQNRHLSPPIPTIRETSEESTKSSPASTISCDTKPNVSSNVQVAQVKQMNIWICPRCTLENLRWRITCEACDMWRPNPFELREQTQNLPKNDSTQSSSTDMKKTSEVLYPKLPHLKIDSNVSSPDVNVLVSGSAKIPIKNYERGEKLNLDISNININKENVNGENNLESGVKIDSKVKNQVDNEKNPKENNLDNIDNNVLQTKKKTVPASCEEAKSYKKLIHIRSMNENEGVVVNKNEENSLILPVPAQNDEIRKARIAFFDKTIEKQINLESKEILEENITGQIGNKNITSTNETRNQKIEKTNSNNFSHKDDDLSQSAQNSNHNVKVQTSETKSQKINLTSELDKQKLKEMLIEMKHSLPKRPKPLKKGEDDNLPEKKEQNSNDIFTTSSSGPKEAKLTNDNITVQKVTTPTTSSQPESANKGYAEAYLIESETIIEEVKIKKPSEKVSSSVQTSGLVTQILPSVKPFVGKELVIPIKVEENIIKDGILYTSLSNGVRKIGNGTFELLRPRDFANIKEIKIESKETPLPVYANVSGDSNSSSNFEDGGKSSEYVEKLSKQLTNPEGVANFRARLDGKNDKMNTIAVNRLLKRLESTIASGHHELAAGLARELAQLKVSCSVIRQKDQLSNNTILLDLFVEDKVSHQGPFHIKVKPSITVKELKELVEREYEIPVGVQRWILDNQLAGDDASTLESYGVKTDGFPIFLYLVAPDLNTAKVEGVSETEVKPSTSDTPPIVQENLHKERKQVLTEEYLLPGPSGVKVNTKKTSLENVLNEANLTGTLALGWKCEKCTLVNSPTRPGCAACSTGRPAFYKVPEEYKPNKTEELRIQKEIKNDQQSLKNEEEEKAKNYQQLVELEKDDLIIYPEEFECQICLVDYPKMEGIVLRECLHVFCRNCLANTIQYSDEAEVKCPYRDDNYTCDSTFLEREIKALVTPQAFEEHLAKSIALAETKIGNTFHCKTPDCNGWCIYEDNVNVFKCPVCTHTNCLTCQAVHEGLNCKQYQEQLLNNSDMNIEVKRTKEMLQEMVDRGEAMNCPTCQVVLMKKWGCDWLRCSMCKTEICWITRGPRWGPNGKGDTSGGCQCGVNGIKCHPKCTYCH